MLYLENFILVDSNDCQIGRFTVEKNIPLCIQNLFRIYIVIVQ